MSKRHTVSLNHVISVCDYMLDHMDCVMRASVKKQTQCKEDLFLAVKLARQKRSKYYAEVTPTTGILLISAHILNSFQTLQ